MIGHSHVALFFALADRPGHERDDARGAQAGAGTGSGDQPRAAG